MSRYELFHPDTEILGQIILDFSQAIGADRFGPILERHGLTDLESDRWYPGQIWVDVLNDVAAEGGGMMDFVSLGIRQMDLVQWPPGFSDMPLTEMLQSLNEAYRMNYRGSDIGGIEAEIVSDNHVKMIVRSFEPDALWYGNLYGFMRLFAAGQYMVTYDETVPRREEGGEVTIIHLTWE